MWYGIGALDGLGIVLVFLATISVVQAIFNMVPAFPMDGGSVLRAYLWHRHEDVLKATKTPTRSGVFFGAALMMIGVLAIF